ncbi:MAG: methyltransferase [Myxococcota bacterium]
MIPDPALPLVPPRWILSPVLAVRAALRALHDQLVPAPVALLERSMGIAQTMLLHVAARLDLAGMLERGPATAPTLAADLDVDADALDRILRALVAHGVFARDAEGRYRNNRLSRGLLASTPGGGPWMAAFSGDACNVRAWAAIDHVVATGQNGFEHANGRPVWDWLGDHPAEREAFAAGMQSATALSASAIVSAGDFGRFPVVCDVAGGRGLLLGAILRRHPGARGVLLDRAEVLAGARPVLARMNVADHCTLVPGDMFTEVPSADAYVLKDILHDWDDAAAARILASVRRAARPGARLLVVEMLVHPVEHDPIVHFTDVLMLCLVSGRQRSASDLDALLGAGGFARERIVPVDGVYSLVEAVAR